MSEPNTKQKRTLTAEQKAKMAAGRTAAAAKRAAEKEEKAEKTPTKMGATEVVCPPLRPRKRPLKSGVSRTRRLKRSPRRDEPRAVR